MVRRTAKMNIGKKIGQCNKQHTYTSVFIQLTDMGDDGRVNIDVPRYDQSKYWGRATHMAVITNPLNLFATPAALNHSNDIVTRYKKVFYMILCYNVTFNKYSCVIAVRPKEVEMPFKEAYLHNLTYF